MTISLITKRGRIKIALKTVVALVLVMCNLLTGYPGQLVLDFSQNILRDRKIVDLMYWAVKDDKVVDSYIAKGVPNVIKVAHAVSATHTEVYNSTTTWIAPTGVTSVAVEAWGGGGAGAGGTATNDGGQAGGGAGAYAKTNNISVNAGNSYAVTIGAGGTAGTAAGGNGGDSGFGDNSQIYADGGNGGSATNGTNASGGTLAVTIGADAESSGGNGGAGGGSTVGSGGGGGSGGSGGNGGNGGNGSSTTGGSAGTAGAGNGAAGGAGVYNAAGTNGLAGTAPGGGGSGSSVQGTPNRTGGAGAKGRAILTFDANFPKVETRNSGSNSSNTTSHTINMPSGVSVGDLLIIVFSCDGTPTATIASGNWTKISQTTDGASASIHAIFYKIAEGSDTATVSTGAASEQSSHITYRISSAGIPTATGVGGSSTNSDPPSHNATVSDNYLWIATRGGDASAGVGVVATVPPTNFSNLTTQNAGSTGGATTSTAERLATASSLDPGTFTSSSESWVSYTVAVPLKPSLTIATSGTQTVNMAVPATDQYVGGLFSISSDATANVTGITITENGTIDAAADITNVRLFYENDTSTPYNCASESFAGIGTEEQYGSTDTDGFSSADGTSPFSETVGISSVSTLCVYVALDVGVGATGDETIEIEISNPSTQVTSNGSTTPATAIAISGTTTLNAVSISISVADANVTYGFVPLSGSKDTLTLTDTQTATNNGNVTEDFSIKGQNATAGGCTWTLSGSAGNNQYAHQFCNDTDLDCTSPPTNYTNLTSTYQTLDTAISASSVVNFQLRIVMPTDSSCFNSQDVDVSLLAEQG